MAVSIDKGARAEEILRNYFRELGYFVMRGVKLKIGGVDVTDVDLWLYNRPSPITRERINVDIKYKKSPHAFERIFWAKGVQGILGFDHCIVATTDKRKDVVEFGRQHDVTVLNGTFLNTLRQKGLNQGINDEQLKEISDKFRPSKAQLGWYDKVSECSSLLTLKLGYDGCNSIIPSLKFFIEQAMINHQRKEEAIRYTYLLISYFLIGLDYALTENSFLTSDERQKAIEEGLMFGTAGKAGTDHIVNLATRLAAASVPGANASVIQKKLTDISGDYPAKILAEYFGRNQVSSKLFSIAKQFNDLSLGKQIHLPNLLEEGLKSALFVFLDFFEYERKEFIEKSELINEQPSLFDFSGNSK